MKHNLTSFQSPLPNQRDFKTGISKEFVFADILTHKY